MTALSKFSGSVVMRLPCLLLLCAGAQAQTGVLTGSIVDELNEPIRAAYISVEGKGQKAETRTDDRGRYRFELLAEGTYELAMFASGWKSMTVESVAIQADRTTELPVVTLYVPSVCVSSDSPRSLVLLKEGEQSVATGTVSAEVGGRISFLKDVLVTISNPTASAQTRTDKDGKFRLEAPPGRYSFTAGGYSQGTITILKE